MPGSTIIYEVMEVMALSRPINSTSGKYSDKVLEVLDQIETVKGAYQP